MEETKVYEFKLLGRIIFNYLYYIQYMPAVHDIVGGLL